MQYFKGRELIMSIPQYGVGHPPHPQLHAWWVANSKPLLGKAQSPPHPFPPLYQIVSDGAHNSFIA